MLNLIDLLIDLGLSALGVRVGGWLYNVNSLFALVLSYPVTIGAIAFGAYKVYEFMRKEYDN